MMNHFRNGSVLNLVLIGLLAVILLGFGTWMYIGGGGVSELDEPLTAKAFGGLFVKEVLDQGEIQGSDTIDIRSQVKSRYGSRGVTVEWAIDEGTPVEDGKNNWFWEKTVMVRLRSDEIQENLENQTIAVNNAKDAKTAADNNFKSATAALNEYLEGTYKELEITIENEISEARELLEEAEEYYRFSLKLQAKNFIQPSELRSDESKVKRAKRSLKLALKKLEVLQKISKEKNITELKSKIDIARSQFEAADTNLKIENATLEEIEKQFGACTIVVPEGVAGQVVHANVFSRRGSSEFILEEGASVREGQVLIKIPDPTKMEVKATVNESRVTSIKKDMFAVISVDALNGLELDGEVTKVNEYAEPEGWGGGGVRKYAVYINIDNPIDELKPGMNSSVLIETERSADALMVPIQAVYGYRGKTFCMIKRNDKWVTVEVQVGSNNDTNVVIESGVEEGDEVALNPAGFKHLLELPDIPEVDEKADRRSKGRGKKSSESRKSGGNGDKKKSRDSGKKQKPDVKDQKKTKEKRYPESQRKGNTRDSGPSSDTARKPSNAADSNA